MSAILNEGLIKQLVQRFFMLRRAGEKTSVILHALLHETYAQGVAAANRAAAAAVAGRMAQEVVSPLSRPCTPTFGALDLMRGGELMALAPSYPSAPVPVPEGWQLVPKEPTPEILSAGQDAGKGVAWSYATCYRAMLAAAPQYNEGESK